MRLDEQKEYYIETILFYRNTYNIGNEKYYNEIMESVINAETEFTLNIWGQLIDDWLWY
jgi:hypothetical protein